MSRKPSPHSSAPRRTAEHQELLNGVAHAARIQLPHLKPLDRARLLEGLALILPASESEQCSIAARALRDAELAQTLLEELLITL